MDDSLAHDLPHCRSVIFFPAGRTPAGKKMTLQQRSRSRARLSSVAISYKPSISCYHTVSISPPSILTTLMQRTQASTLVLARVFCVPIFPSSTPRGCPGHERAYWCSLVLWASFSLPLQRPADSQGTSEHTGARPCPVCPLFYVPSTPCGCAGHERARQCLPVSCTSFFPCPFDIRSTRRTRVSTPVLACVLIVIFSCPFDTRSTHRTRASTLVLARVLISLFDIPWMPRTMVSTVVLTLVMGILFLSL